MAISKTALAELRAWPQHGPVSRGERPIDHQRLAPAPAGAFELAQIGRDLHELEVRFEADTGQLWCAFRHRERPCFTESLLDEIHRFQGRLKHALAGAGWIGALAPPPERDAPVRALIWHSSIPEMWNLGGDLCLFTHLIRQGAREALRRYAYACIDTVYQNWTKFDLPFLTVALVQGDALGGGFEAVLTNDIVVAERQSKFGLPEILFNMFPGMGAYSLLCRRLDGTRAEQMITSGRLYEADELAELGLIDLVVEPGEGVAAVREHLARHARRHAVLGALSRVRRRCQPIDYQELIDVTELWVDTALALDEADLRRMERLASAQHKRFARASGATVH